MRKTATPGLGFGVLARAALAHARLERKATNAIDVTSRFARGLLLEALSSDERAALTIAIYDDLARSGHSQRVVPPFERTWLAEELPRNGRVLVAASGEGREVAALLEAGFTVDAFDPAPRAAQACAALIGSRGRCVCASFDDFTDSALEGRDGPLRAITQTRYDAVLLGFASLMHVRDDAHVDELFTACARVAPAGPILGSISSATRRPLSRAERVGRGMGRALARTRGLAADDARRENLEYLAWAGFQRFFTPDHVDAWGRLLDRDVRSRETPPWIWFSLTSR